MSDAAVGAMDKHGASGPASESAFRRFRRRTKRFLKRNSVGFYAFTLAFLVALMLLSTKVFISIPAGHVGVLWLRFFGGTVVDQYYGEGIHMIFPWDEIYIYDARLQNNARLYDTISSNGLSMQVEIATRYRINREAVGLLHKLVGPRYDEILVYPEIGSHARELISRYTPEQLYSETRGFIQAQILERMVTQLGSSLVNQSVRGKLVNVEDVLIRSVTLPPRVQDAIQRKAEQYQAMLEYDFRLAREAKERDRKRIEAEGVRDFQSIVAKTITDEYLRLRGIEATMALSNSRNSKIIIIGGKDGLPVILNTGDAAAAPAAEPGAAAPAGAAELDVLSNQTNARSMDVTSPNAATSTPADEAGTLGRLPDSAPAASTPAASASRSGPAAAGGSPAPSGTASAPSDAMPAPREQDTTGPVKKEGGDAPVKKEGESTMESLINLIKP